MAITPAKKTPSANIENIEEHVARHYTKPDILKTIVASLQETADDPRNITPEDLHPYDMMHVGGPEATRHLLDKLNLEKGMDVLDIGSGLGGPARQAVTEYGVNVTGIDITPGYQVAATQLCEIANIDKNYEFKTASALNLPFEDNRFDCAYTIHTGMNIPDKETAYREAFRVIKPGAVFGIYDIFAGPNVENLKYPVPWAMNESTSFPEPLETVTSLLERCGFTVLETEKRKEFGVEKLENHEKAPRANVEIAAAPENRIPDPRNVEFSIKIANLIENVRGDCCWPCDIICQKPD